MSEINTSENYCSCIEFSAKGSKGTPSVYTVKPGQKCSSVLPRQAHINSWCCLYTRWKDYLGDSVKSDLDLFKKMAFDPDTYNQKIYPWGDYGWFGPFRTKEEASSAAQNQIKENYLFWNTQWKTSITLMDDFGDPKYEKRSVPGIIGGFNFHGHTINRDGDYCGAITYSSEKTVRKMKDKDGMVVDLWIWEVDGDNNLGTCGWKSNTVKVSKMNCYSFMSLNDSDEFCGNNGYDNSLNNNNIGCWCCGNYTNLVTKFDLIKNKNEINIGPCGNPYQSDKRNGRFGRYDTRPGSSQ